MAVKSDSWLHDLIEIYNDLGGTAAYKDVYRLAEERRTGRGASWTQHAEASIRRTVEDHAQSSANFRGRSVFYSVNGHGGGVWGLMPDYLRDIQPPAGRQQQSYVEGIEGIVQERRYLRRSRDPRLVEARKLIDDYTCQVCSFRLMTAAGVYVIDVHHLRPIGTRSGGEVTSTDDLVCLCPNCHRIAHTGPDEPLSLAEIANCLARLKLPARSRSTADHQPRR